jgi:hypothetical protein
MNPIRRMISECALIEASAEISKFISRYAAAPGLDRDAIWREFGEYLFNLTVTGWDRGDIYEIVSLALRRACTPDQSPLVAHFDDHLGSILGDCHPDCIPRFHTNGVRDR